MNLKIDLNKIFKNNRILILASLLFYFIHVTMCIIHGSKVPWGGDEWFSYENFTLMGLPFSLVVLVMKNFFGQVSSENFLYFRFQGLIWSTIFFSICILFLSMSKNKKIKLFLIFYLLFLCLNPYVIHITTFFRYYSLYLYSSSALTIFFLINDKKYAQKRSLIYLLGIFSIFIHLFLFIQIIIYIYLKEMLLSNKKVYFLSFSGIAFFIIIPFLPQIISYLFNSLFPIYKYEYAFIHRGYSLSTVLKPIMVVFTFIFGHYQKPFSLISVDILFTFYGLILVYGLYKLIKVEGLEHPLILAGVAPLIISFLIIEPISLPAMPQVSPHHVIFVFPWLFFIFFIPLLGTKFGFFINLIFFYGNVYANYLNMKTEFIDYNYINEKIPSSDVPIISDAPKNYNFFINDNNFIWYGNSQEIIQSLDNEESIGLLIGNWKVYNTLKPLQFWHNPSGSENELNKLNSILINLNNQSFHLVDSYSFFPVQFYLFNKKKIRSKSNLWFYDMKYRDLKLPLYIDGNKIIGFEKVFYGNKKYIESGFYYFIQSDSPEKINNAIEIRYDNGSIKYYDLDKEYDKYRSFFCRSIEGDDIVYNYNKMPLISNSMKYSGSIFKAESRIYYHNTFNGGCSLEIKNQQITLIKAIISRDNH